MTYRRLVLRCACGHEATQVNDCGLTAQHELVIRWKCEGCENDIFVVKSLSECWRECPTGDEEAPDAHYPFVSDAQFLRAMKVKFPDGEEL
jgi:hypothetical protein